MQCVVEKIFRAESRGRDKSHPYTATVDVVDAINRVWTIPKNQMSVGAQYPLKDARSCAHTRMKPTNNDAISG